MEAICAECGLEFSCANVLSPRFLGPHWSFEHPMRVRISRWCRTSLAALDPRRFTRELRVDHQINPSRVRCFGLSWMLIVHVAAAAGVVAMVTRARSAGMWWSGSRWDAWGTYALDDPRLLIGGTLAMVFPYTQSPGHVPWPAVFLLTYPLALLMPLWMCILTDSFAIARVRRAHLARGWAYSMPGAACFTLLLLAMLSFGASMAARRVGGLWSSLVVSVGVCYLVYHAGWWYLFIRRYLRLRHAASVVILLSIMSLLVAAIIGLVSAILASSL
jgi:hypothetical protein